MAHHYPYKLLNPNLEYTSDPAVYKLYFGKKYFIFKGKSFISSIEQNLRDINIQLAKPGNNISHLFWPIVEHIKKSRSLSMVCQVDLVCQTTGQALVDCERLILQAAQKDPACLNTIFTPHIPRWLEEEITGGTKPVKEPDQQVKSPLVKQQASIDRIVPPVVTKSIVEPKNEPSKSEQERIDKLLARL